MWVHACYDTQVDVRGQQMPFLASNLAGVSVVYSTQPGELALRLPDGLPAPCRSPGLLMLTLCIRLHTDATALNSALTAAQQALSPH